MDVYVSIINIVLPTIFVVFLCAEDKFTGQSHEYRRGQVEEQLLFFLLYLPLIYMLCGDDQSYSSEINWTARIKR
jgi:hypothetical protein